MSKKFNMSKYRFCKGKRLHSDRIFFELQNVFLKNYRPVQKQGNQIPPTPFAEGGVSMDPSFSKRGWGDLQPLMQYAH